MKSVAGMLALMVAFEAAGCAWLAHGSTDRIAIRSDDPKAQLYLDDKLVGTGSGEATVERGRKYTIIARAPGCADGTATTGYSFDQDSLGGILIDLGIISILVVDMALTDAAWATDPTEYTVDPACPPSAAPAPPQAHQRGTPSALQRARVIYRAPGRASAASA
jgi:hypothetical protein